MASHSLWGFPPIRPFLVLRFLLLSCYSDFPGYDLCRLVKACFSSKMECPQWCVRSQSDGNQNLGQRQTQSTSLGEDGEPIWEISNVSPPTATPETVWDEIYPGFSRNPSRSWGNVSFTESLMEGAQAFHRELIFGSPRRSLTGEQTSGS